MKKGILLLLLLLPFSVLAETYTITYDANDGSGRQQTVTYTNVQYFDFAGYDFFEPLEDDPDDPSDDIFINRWTLQSDNTDWGYYPTGDYEISDVFTSSNSILLYAKWEKRTDLANLLTSIKINDTEMLNTDPSNINVGKYEDFSLSFTFIEDYYNRNGTEEYYGMSFYNSYKLPDWAMNLFSKSFYRYLAEPSNLPVRLAGLKPYHGGHIDMNGLVYYGIFYIKDGYLYIDLPHDGSDESIAFFACDNVSMNIIYNVHWDVGYNNGYEYHYASLSGSVTMEDVRETGTVNINYIDIDTEEELSEAETSAGNIGDVVPLIEKEIDGYELAEVPPEELYHYETEEKTIYYKYRKIGSNKYTNNKKTVKGESEIQENPKTGINNYIIIAILLIPITVFAYYKIIKNEYFKKY